MRKTIVRSHKRRTKSGKIVEVRKYTRSIVREQELEKENRNVGWKKVKDTHHDIQWRCINDESEYVRVVSQEHLGSYYLYPYGHPKWDVWIATDEIIADIKTFKTKSNALRFAINWMKKHPKGYKKIFEDAKKFVKKWKKKHPNE